MHTLYFFTNRNPIVSKNNITAFGNTFHSSHPEYLRFGRISFEFPEQIENDLNTMASLQFPGGEGRGNIICEIVKDFFRYSKLEVYPEIIVEDYNNQRLGSLEFFDSVKVDMMNCTDVVSYVHGFNNDWMDSVSSAMALQIMLNKKDPELNNDNTKVVLFSWPSDGKMIPFMSYASDRADAVNSGKALARAILKARDFLISIQLNIKLKVQKGIPILKEEELCNQDIHLLCHSMGNYVLQNALPRLNQNTPGSVYPKMFRSIFMCAADVDDNVLEASQPLGQLNELADQIFVYHNRKDRALFTSDFTKGNPERLGSRGAARPAFLHHKINQIDCSNIFMEGFSKHGYYLDGDVIEDIRKTVKSADISQRKLELIIPPNVWRLL